MIGNDLYFSRNEISRNKFIQNDVIQNEIIQNDNAPFRNRGSKSLFRIKQLNVRKIHTQFAIY